MTTHIKNNCVRYIIFISILFILAFIFSDPAYSDSKEGKIDPGETVYSPTDKHLPVGESPESPTTSGGSGGTPIAKYNLIVNVEEKEPYRNTSVFLNLTIKNKNQAKLKIQYIKLIISHDFKLIHDIKREIQFENTPVDIKGNSIKLGPFKLNGLEGRTFKLEIGIPNQVEAKNISVLARKPEIKFKKYKTFPPSEQNNSIISIRNNLPSIRSANANLAENQVRDLQENGTLLFIGNCSKPIEILYKINATDIEDGKELMFAGSLKREGEVVLNNSTSIDDIVNVSKFGCQIEKFELGNKYVAWALVKDKDNGSIKRIINISYSGDEYRYLLIPDVSFREKAALIISPWLPLIIAFIMIAFFRSCKPRILNGYILSAIIILIWTVYLLALNQKPQPLSSAMFIFFNSLPFFELGVYLTVFFIISYFCETCFSMDNKRHHASSLLINSIFMFIILIIFLFIMPHILITSNYISSYYSTMSGIFGTIFGLVVTLSGQFPKNILTIDPHHSNACQTDDKKSDNNLFSYHKKIRYFVGLYGVALGLSLLGLITGMTVKFNTIIMDLNADNLINLFSIAVFEITFLLIPPTILSSYQLLQVIYFRGKISIKSDPIGAELSIIGKYNEQNKNFNNILEDNNLGLITPCTLRLPEGRYKIELLYKYSYTKIPEEISIKDGMEKEYSFKLPESISSSKKDNNKDECTYVEIEHP